MFRYKNIKYLQKKSTNMSPGKHTSDSKKNIILRLSSKGKPQSYIISIFNKSLIGVINTMNQYSVKRK